MPLKKLKYRPDIDGLRAIAVLSVVLYHAFPWLIPGGFIGVDVFFVISGFLIATIILERLLNHSFSFIDFYRNRIKRIFPALLIILIVCLVTGWFLLLPNEYNLLGKHIAAAAGFIANYSFWNEGNYFAIVNAETKPVLHLWSLGIEEQFYIVWPLLLFMIWKFKPNYVVIFTWGLAVISFALNVYGMQNPLPTAIFYSPQTRAWELLMGCGLAYY
ncbi:MAG: acyltransferase [bacterium]|nr:acyltransferase [bacterium]